MNLFIYEVYYLTPMEIITIQKIQMYDGCIGRFDEFKI